MTVRAIVLLLAVLSLRTARADVWFIQAEGSGNGSSAASPLGSTSALSQKTKLGDVILLLPSATPLDGGIALKQRQTLIGLSANDRKPTITNTSAELNHGHGVVLADDCSVLNVRIERTLATGVWGAEVSGANLQGIEVHEANASSTSCDLDVPVLGKISHGGILFLTTRRGNLAENRLHDCVVTNTAGISVGAFALNGGRCRLIASHLRVEGGGLVPPLFDVGAIALADGRETETHLELSDATIRGRLGEQGRNVIVFATADGKATATIERSKLGSTGQDGVVAVAALVPAIAEVEIRDSTIERAGQMNIEGTILNLPPSDPKRADEAIVSIDVRRSVLRDAGAADGPQREAYNIWLAPTVFGPGPFAAGRYRLTVWDSVLTNTAKTGIAIGNAGSQFGIAPDSGNYRVYMRNNTIQGMGPIEIAAKNAQVDAQKNFWGTAAGLLKEHVAVRDEAERGQIDASNPLPKAVHEFTKGGE